MRKLAVLAASVALAFPQPVMARTKVKPIECRTVFDLWRGECGGYQGSRGESSRSQGKERPSRDTPSKNPPSKGPDKNPPSKGPDKEPPSKDPCGGAMLLVPGTQLACGAPSRDPGCGDAMLVRPGDILACGPGTRGKGEG